MSERALGSESQPGNPSNPSNAHSQSWKQFARAQLKDFSQWLWTKARFRIGLTLCIAIISIVVLFRPLFSTVFHKSIALSVRVILRRSIGFLALLVDAVLFEAANSLEASLITPPASGCK